METFTIIYMSTAPLEHIMHFNGMWCLGAKRGLTDTANDVAAGDILTATVVVNNVF